MSDVSDWVRCPECGGECEIRQPEIYHSHFECIECGESLTQGWIYYEDDLE